MAKIDARGFTLIEAMVAMVVIGAAGMALFAWVNSSVLALGRVEAANARNAAVANAIEYMQAINPMATADGETRLGDLTLAWKSTPSTAVVDGSDYPRGRSFYQLALYDTEVQGKHADGTPWFELKLKLVGYKKVRDSVKPF